MNENRPDIDGCHVIPIPYHPAEVAPKHSMELLICKFEIGQAALLTYRNRFEISGTHLRYIFDSETGRKSSECHIDCIPIFSQLTFEVLQYWKSAAFIRFVGPDTVPRIFGANLPLPNAIMTDLAVSLSPSEEDRGRHFSSFSVVGGSGVIDDTSCCCRSRTSQSRLLLSVD